MLRLETIKWAMKQRYFVGKLVILLSFTICWEGALLGRVAGDNANVLSPPEQPKDEDLQIANFRSTKWDHNFALSLGGARGDWILDQFGPVQGQKFDSKAYFAKFQYSFHLALAGDFGYVIGSSFGYYWERTTDEQQFRRVSSIHFPGIHAGLVYSLTSFLRVECAFETYLERLDNLQINTSSGSSTPTTYSVSVTMRPNYDWILLSDFFYSENWGVRLEWHARNVNVNPPTESEGQVIGARLTKKDIWIGLGLLYHLFAS